MNTAAKLQNACISVQARIVMSYFMTSSGHLYQFERKSLKVCNQDPRPQTTNIRSVCPQG